jgi:hypothetical protein
MATGNLIVRFKSVLETLWKVKVTEGNLPVGRRAASLLNNVVSLVAMKSGSVKLASVFK